MLYREDEFCGEVNGTGGNDIHGKGQRRIFHAIGGRAPTFPGLEIPLTGQDLPGAHQAGDRLQPIGLEGDLDCHFAMR